MVALRIFDGVKTIGGNKILLQDGDTKLWLDFGLNMGLQSDYYEEYLKAKSCTGLYEPVLMGILPPIRDLYRQDMNCSVADPWALPGTEDLGDVSGIIISHGHFDHIGGLHFVRNDIPIYSSLSTAMMMKGSQDSAGGSIQGDYCYTVAVECDEAGLLSRGHHSKCPSASRAFRCVGEQPSSSLQEFWGWTPSCDTQRGRKHNGNTVEVTDNCGGLNIKRFPVDHSVYGACAWAVETSEGWVVYSGDLRAHGHYADSTWKFAEEAAKLKPRALIIEGTRITGDPGGTERSIASLALDEVKNADALVVADFGLRHVERLVSFLKVAEATGRKLVILPKDAYLLYAMGFAGSDQFIPKIDNGHIVIYWEYQNVTATWQKMIHEKFGHLAVRPQDIAQNQDQFICCFSFLDVNELAYIRPRPGSKWIYSSNEAFSEDLKIDFDRLGNWVEKFGMDFPGDPRVDEPGKPPKSPYHVSGHACKDDLLKLIRTIAPKELIPVHSTSPEDYVELLQGVCKVTLPERGVTIPL